MFYLLNLFLGNVPILQPPPPPQKKNIDKINFQSVRLENVMFLKIVIYIDLMMTTFQTEIK